MKTDHLSRAELEIKIHELSNKIEEYKCKKELAALRARMADHFYENSEPVNCMACSLANQSGLRYCRDHQL